MSGAPPAPRGGTAGLAGLILAGGRSSRMGRLKPLLPFAGSTVLECAIRTLTGAGLDEVVVVVGHEGERLRPAVERLGVRCVTNPDHAQGMFTSVVAGVRALPPGAAGCLVLPADMPAVRSRTVRLLARVFGETGAAVVYPSFEGRRGHPPLVSARVFPSVLSSDGRGGLHAVLESFAPQACAVRVLDEGVVLDLDTPADYEEARQRLGVRSVPSPRECDALLADLEVAAPIVRHGAMVAEVAQRIAGAMERAGHAVDSRVLRAAALLHDLAKGKPEHAHAAATLLAQLEFPRVAEAVGAHTDLPPGSRDALDEAAVLYLADKLVRGERPISLRERFAASEARCGGSPEGRAAWERRRHDAEAVAAGVEGLIGQGRLAALLGELGAEPAFSEACRGR